MKLKILWKREDTWKLSLPSESSGSVSSSSVGLHSCTIGIGIVPISEIFYQNILIDRSNFRNISSNIPIDWSHSWNNLSKYSFYRSYFWSISSNILVDCSHLWNILLIVVIDCSHSWIRLLKYSYWSFPCLKYFIKIFLLIVFISEIFYQTCLLIVPISEISYQNILIDHSHVWNILSKYSYWLFPFLEWFIKTNRFPFLKYFINIILLIVTITKIFHQNVFFYRSHLWNIDENTLIGWYKSVQLLNNQNCTQL